MSLNSKVHILGSFQNIKMARTAICNLILGKDIVWFVSSQGLRHTLISLNPYLELKSNLLNPFTPTGSPPSKVYGNIRVVASRAAERF